MCGIAGAFQYAAGEPSPALAGEVAVVRESMAARGPDGKGEWSSADGAVVLGHRRLAVIDLSERGAQPMHSAEHGLTVVFNGEIYNYAELRGELAAKGYRFRSTSDTGCCCIFSPSTGSTCATVCAGCMPSPSMTSGRKRWCWRAIRSG
jgi:asparagine synthase (glutamine-hydrolysing)